MKWYKVITAFCFLVLCVFNGYFISKLIDNIWLIMTFSILGGITFGLCWAAVDCWIDFKQELKKKDGTERTHDDTRA